MLNEKGADTWPAGIDTLLGETVTGAAPLFVNDTVAPPGLGAGPSNDTTPEPELPPVIPAGVNTTVCSNGNLVTVSVVCTCAGAPLVVVPYVADMVAVVSADTTLVEAVNWVAALLVVIEVGTCTEPLLLCKEMVAGVFGTPFNVTIPVA